MWTQWLSAQLIFLSKPIFCNLFEFAATKSTQESICSTHLSSEYCELNSIKSDLLRALQQLQEHPQIPIQFSVSILIYLVFIEKMVQ